MLIIILISELLQLTNYIQNNSVYYDIVFEIIVL